MALPARQQFTYWGIAAAVLVLLLWGLGQVLLPFVLGAAIAYLLDPVADRLEAWGLSRAAATAVITVAAILIFFLMMLLVIPTLAQQAVELFNIAPKLFEDLRSFLERHLPSLFENGSATRQMLEGLGRTIQERGGEFMQTALASVSSVVNIIMLLVIVPVVAVYLLLDWDRMIARIDGLLPRDHAPVIRQLAADIDRTLAGFIRGMGTVCMILGGYYAIALMFAGLTFGLVVGVIAGALTFIPYVGAFVGGALAIGLALFQFWGDWLQIGVIAAIFVAGQMAEGNFLTPKLVGNSVGLHPVWLLLALSVFGSLFGFIGMLVAVPLAAALGVIVRFFIDQYKQSRLYRGIEQPPEQP